MSESFLSRWSRRKDEARQNEIAPPVPEANRATDGGAANLQPAVDAPEPELTSEEIAALPKIDELTADSDVTVFLRRGVPEVLRNAALRRIWMLDPAIRDFAGHARDYAYDWNAPGGVPGNGAIEPGEEVASMVRRILGEKEPELAPTSEAAAAEPDAPEQERRSGTVHADDATTDGPDAAGDGGRTLA